MVALRLQRPLDRVGIGGYGLRADAPPRSCRWGYTPFGGLPPVARLHRASAVKAWSRAACVSAVKARSLRSAACRLLPVARVVYLTATKVCTSTAYGDARRVVYRAATKVCMSIVFGVARRASAVKARSL